MTVGIVVLYYVYQTVYGKSGGSSTLGIKNSNHAQAITTNTTFADVKGCDEAIEEIMDVVDFLKNPNKYQAMGARLPRGVLMSGPPGTGKTLLARAIAGEAGVPFFYATGSSFDEIFVGMGPKRIRAMFEEARKKQPCIIFIDEIDALGSTRRLNGNSRESLNQMLTEMDGFQQNSGIIVIGATNLPEKLDPALTRPGRFDRIVTVNPPNLRGRKEILDLYVNKIRASNDIDTSVIARGTPGYTGAQLRELVNRAAVKSATKRLKKVTMAMMEEARDDIMMGVERKTHSMTKRDMELTAYHEAGHALVALYSEGAHPVHKATILPRGQALGVTHFLPVNDQVSINYQQLNAQLALSMGGRAAEELIYGKEFITTGASSDLRSATRIATDMVARAGMSPKVGFIYHDKAEADKNPDVRTEVKKILDERYSYAYKVLEENKLGLHRVAKALLEREVLTGEEIAALARGEQLPPLVLNQPEKKAVGGGWKFARQNA